MSALKVGLISLLTAFAAVAPVKAAEKYAAVVIDVKTGKTLHNEDADEMRYPASITKVMTLYMLFEQLEAGKIKLSTPLHVSAEAAGQAPSKIGVRAGSTITAEEAIRALVTKSANDVAVVVAEAIGNDEEDFAELMTEKARWLGMTKTTFKNASGLPHAGQMTTARDLATLGRSIQDRFPKYYKYFSTYSFAYRGSSYRNHNRLLGRFHGVDGIKTGYTRASGFNLLSSVKRGNRHVIAVVMGGTSGPSRDARVRVLVENNMSRAHDGARTMPLLAEAAKPVVLKPQPAVNQMAQVMDVASKPLQMNKPAAAMPKSDWVIQIGAFPVETAAKEALALAKTAGGKSLTDKDSYTENVDRGASKLVRARFAGFETKNDAENACKVLKKSDFACLPVPSKG
jgi:D-alanyl-D-alanine carboxypeptidase